MCSCTSCGSNCNGQTVEGAERENDENQTLFAIVAIHALVVTGSSATGADPGDITFEGELVEVKGATDGISVPDTDQTSLPKGYGYRAASAQQC